SGSVLISCSRPARRRPALATIRACSPMSARRSLRLSISMAVSTWRAPSSSAGGTAPDQVGCAAARPQDGAAGMGAGARPGIARLSYRGNRRAGASPYLHGHRLGRRIAAGECQRFLETRGRGCSRSRRARGARHGVMSEAAPRRCGYVALVGAPNAGKSTLLNQLVGAKLSIVSPKVQTTRSRVLGIVVEDAAQLVFVDTPGIFAPKRRLERAMVAAAWAGAEDADFVVVLVDAARGVDADAERIIAGLKSAGRRAVLVLNKVDLVDPPRLLPLADRLRK